VSRPVTSNHIESVIKSLPSKTRWMFYQTSWESNATSDQVIPKEIEEEGIFPNTFYNADIMQMLKPIKDQS
jgi:hypothetical protein